MALASPNAGVGPGQSRVVPSGVAGLDQLVDGLRLGDNVVWQVDDLSQYARFARPFVERCLQDGRRCHYLRFGGHEPVVPPLDGLELIQLDPSPGFDRFRVASLSFGPGCFGLPGTRWRTGSAVSSAAAASLRRRVPS